MHARLAGRGRSPAGLPPRPPLPWPPPSGNEPAATRASALRLPPFGSASASAGAKPSGLVTPRATPVGVVVLVVGERENEFLNSLGVSFPARSSRIRENGLSRWRQTKTAFAQGNVDVMHALPLFSNFIFALFGVQDTEKIVLGNFRNFLRFDDGPELRGLHREGPLGWPSRSGGGTARRGSEDRLV